MGGKSGVAIPEGPRPVGKYSMRGTRLSRSLSTRRWVYQSDSIKVLTGQNGEQDNTMISLSTQPSRAPEINPGFNQVIRRLFPRIHDYLRVRRGTNQLDYCLDGIHPSVWTPLAARCSHGIACNIDSWYISSPNMGHHLPDEKYWNFCSIASPWYKNGIFLIRIQEWHVSKV